MASALIRIDQAINPIPIGVGGRARDDLILGQPVTMRNSDDTDVNRHVWALLDRPIGSLAVLSSVTAAQVTYIPDLPGMYRVRLSVNDGLAGQIDTRCGGVRDPFSRLYPAAGQKPAEANYLVNGVPNDLGWAKEVERVLRGLAVPQYLTAIPSDTIPAAAASTSIVVAALGLPTSEAEFKAFDFVDVKPVGNSGSPPTVNGVSLAAAVGDAGIVELCFATFDLNTTSATVDDVWVLAAVTEVSHLLMSTIVLS